MKKTNCEKHRFLLTELIVALGIIAMVMLPLASSYFKEDKLLKALYFRSVAEQILDGEREALMAGDWRKYPPGTYLLSIKSDAFSQLPEKEVLLTVSDVEGRKRKFVLNWKPKNATGIKKISKEVIFNVD